MLDLIISEKWLRARAVFCIYPAAADGDDILLYQDESRDKVIERMLFLRQQRSKARGRSNRCLADYVAPLSSDRKDYTGLFAVTAGLGIERKIEEFEAIHDDYQSILLKALADRLAEAFTEHLHQRVRREFWGYAADESLENPKSLSGKNTRASARRQVIRPALTTAKKKRSSACWRHRLMRRWN